jgi:hypothetical protein
MSEKYFENFWNCPSCGTKNISALRKMRCPNCSASKTTQDFENARMVEITDEYGLKLAKSGKNWACSYCQSVNLDVDQKCSGCSADRSEQTEGAFRVEDVTEKVKGHEVVVQSTETRQDEHVEQCRSSGHVRERKRSSRSRRTEPEYNSESEYSEPEKSESSFRGSYRWESNSSSPRRLSSNQWIALSVTLFVIAVSAFVYWTKGSYPGELTSFYWERNVQVEIYKTLHDSGWDHPYDAFNVNSYSKVHHYDPIYETRMVSEQEAYTVTVYVSKTRYINNGNGSTKAVTEQVPQTQTKYRTVTRPKEVKVGERPIYRTYYEYNVNRWTYHNTLYSSGEDKNKIYWPEFTPAIGGFSNLGATRLGNRSQSLYVYAKWVLGKEEKRDKFKVDSYDGKMIGDKIHVNYLLGVPTSIEFDPKGENNL